MLKKLLLQESNLGALLTAGSRRERSCNNPARAAHLCERLAGYAALRHDVRAAFRQHVLCETEARELLRKLLDLPAPPLEPRSADCR
jgi:hypothetical protein